MRRWARRATALGLALALGACSGGTGELNRSGAGLTSVRVVGLLRDNLRARREGPAPFTLTRAQLAAAGITQPVLLARLPSGEAAGLVPAASNRGRIVWATEDGITLTGRGGVLAATRGLGGDLLSAETEPVVLALAAGREARYRRVLRRLDGEGLILRQPYDCALRLGPREVVSVLGRRHDTRLSTETCRPVVPTDPETPAAYAAVPFTNTYNVGDGTIWVSRQWVGPSVGSLRLERVIE